MARDRILAVDGSWGIYIPQRFVERFPQFHDHIEPDDLTILQSGPEHEHYWDVWDGICRDFSVVSEGVTYYLECDDDLFFTPAND
jgi:hypothetical protein